MGGTTLVSLLYFGKSLLHSTTLEIGNIFVNVNTMNMSWEPYIWFFCRLLKDKLLPPNKLLPKSHQDAKKLIFEVGLESQLIHACVNDCIIYCGEYELLNNCFICGKTRYWQDFIGFYIPQKVL